MSFRVKFSPEGTPTEYGNEDTYEFLPSGVLKIEFSEPARAEYYPPHAWYQVIAEDDHAPGGRGGPYDPKSTIY